MNIHLIIVAFLEGITEFLPISSTAHLIIASKFLNIDTTQAYIKFYLLFIQFGALLAGFIIFSKRIFSDRQLLVNIFISFLPSAIIGFVLYKMFKKLLEGNMILLATMLILGALVFIYLEKIFMKKTAGSIENFGKDEITKMDAFVVGVAQSVAIIPGVSRSGATIIAGIFRGIKKAAIFEYTFILALPTLFVAVAYDIYQSRDLLSNLPSFAELSWGFLISFVVSVITLRILKKHLSQLSLTAFAVYRIILAVVVIMVFV